MGKRLKNIHTFEKHSSKSSVNDIIRSEIDKETPDWILISKLAREMVSKKAYTCPLGFKKGYFNFVKTSGYSDIQRELLRLNDSNIYSVKVINFVEELLPSINRDEIDNKITIFISHRDLNNYSKFPTDIPLQRFTGTERINNKEITYHLTNREDRKRVNFKDSDIVPIIRDSRLDYLL
jgi:hypothetical protein